MKIFDVPADVNFLSMDDMFSDAFSGDMSEADLEELFGGGGN